MTEKRIQARFDRKIEELEKELPTTKKSSNCAELTLTSILDVLGIDNYLFHNIAKPLAGGFGGYKSKEGWMGACGAVAGGCASIGAIIGGKKLIENDLPAYMKANGFARAFEKEFGSVVCSGLCGYDFSNPAGMMEYVKNNTWQNICYKYVVWAVDTVRKMTKEELTQNWE